MRLSPGTRFRIGTLPHCVMNGFGTIYAHVHYTLRNKKINLEETDDSARSNSRFRQTALHPTRMPSVGTKVFHPSLRY
jgi:hypothetical protein